MSNNPYAAPTTHVADVVQSGPEGNFVADGRARPAGNGWAWIKSARALTKRQGWLWIGLFVVFAILTGALSAVPAIGPVVMYILMPVLFGGIMLACDKAHKGSEIEFGDFFTGFRSHFGKLAGIGLTTLLFYALIFAVVAAIFGATAALVMAGMSQLDPSNPTVALSMLLAALVIMALSVPVYMALWFSYALVAINDFGVIQSLKTSFFACLKNITPFLVYGIVMFLFAIAATIPLMLGWLILGPVLLASFYTGYRDIFYEN